MYSAISKYLFLVISLLFTNLTCISQTSIIITNLPNDTPNEDTLYMSTSNDNWVDNDEIHAFERNNDNTFRLEIKDFNTPLKYRITRGSKEKVESDFTGKIKETRIISSVDSIYKIEIKGWYDFITKEEKTLSKNVRVLDSAFSIPQLKCTRRIWIYLPEGYSESDEKYPVIYMHDGQNLFDNSTSFSGEWKIDETIDSLTSNGAKKAIVIGIDNGGKERINEYTPFVNKEYGGGDGSKYMNFIVSTLKPYIDKNYRTLSDRNNTTIAGSSLGGLISFYGIMKYKKVFSKAVIMSPSFWFSNKIYFIPSNRTKYPIKLLFVAGDSESETMIPNIDKMIFTLKKMKYPESSYHLDIIKDGIHNEKLWGDNFGKCYKWIMEN